MTYSRDSSCLRVMIVVLLLGGGFSCGTVLGADVPGSLSSAPLDLAYVWYDGDQERKIWLNPTLLAEFNPNPVGESALKSVSPLAQTLPSKHRGIRLWRIEPATSSESISRRLKSLQPSGVYSPVFHEGPSEAASLRLVPGNIIVYLNPSWNQAAVLSWASVRKLEILRQLEVGPNIFLIKTGPGLEALETANMLYRSGEVIAAFPDWWTEKVPK